jgi:hypothetical protein
MAARNRIPAEYIRLLYALSLVFPFRLNCGFKAGFLLNAFGFAAPSPFISLPTESRLGSRLSAKSFGFAAPSPFISLPSPSPFLSLLLAFSLPEKTVSLSLATEWTLRSGREQAVDRIHKASLLGLYCFSLFLLSSTCCFSSCDCVPVPFD